MTLQAKSYDLRLRVLEMMHIGEKPVFSKKGLVTSLAWGMGARWTMCWRATSTTPAR